MPKAKNLKYCRMKAKLTQQELADAIGASKSTIIGWESKKRAIPVPSAKKVAEFFGVGYEEFCDVDLELLDRDLEHGAFVLSDSEKQSILMFRQLPTNVKKLFRYALAVSYENTMKNKAE